LGGGIWDGRDDTGRPVAAGVYTVRTTTTGSNVIESVSVTRLR
jgi:flagellar hook assembly protein FlgD